MADQEIRLDVIFDNYYQEALNSFRKMAKPHGQGSTLDMDMSLLHVISRTPTKDGCSYQSPVLILLQAGQRKLLDTSNLLLRQTPYLLRLGAC